jgi:hypothetical protein
MTPEQIEELLDTLKNIQIALQVLAELKKKEMARG